MAVRVPWIRHSGIHLSHLCVPTLMAMPYLLDAQMSVQGRSTSTLGKGMRPNQYLDRDSQAAGKSLSSATAELLNTLDGTMPPLRADRPSDESDGTCSKTVRG